MTYHHLYKLSTFSWTTQVPCVNAYPSTLKRATAIYDEAECYDLSHNQIPKGEVLLSRSPFSPLTPSYCYYSMTSGAH